MMMMIWRMTHANADDEDYEGLDGGAATRTKKSQTKKNVTVVHSENTWNHMA